ncbi:MAG: caspase family protein [Thermoguttaceae bacterium]|nr:caspase family protein [Thermoguttaceae bacterium]
MRFSTCAIAAFIAFASLFSVAAADGANVVVPKIRVLCVNLESYAGAPLKYADSDLRSLQDALVGCELKIIREETYLNPQNFKEAFQKDVSDWCASLRSDETGVLYLAGHGVKDRKTDKFYIPMLNFLNTPEERQFQDAAVPYSWIRDQLEAADCKHRVVFVDACYSGATSRAFGDKTDSPVREFIPPVSRDGGASSRITVFASSSAEQESWLWDAQKSSLFTYWLAKGLAGYADENDDFRLTLDELNAYVVQRVESVSNSPSEKMKPQTPIMHNASANASLSFVRPARKTNKAADYCAEFIDRALRKFKSERKLENVRVAFPTSFFTGEKGSQTDAISYGVFPQYFTQKLENILVDDADEAIYDFVDLSDDLGALTKEDLQNYVEDEELDAAVLGRLYYDPETAGVLKIQITLMTFKKDQANGAPKTSRYRYSERIWLTPDDCKRLGVASTSSTSEAPAPPEKEFVDGPVGAVAAPEFREAEKIAEQVAKAQNPIDDLKSPFKIQIYVQNPVSKIYEPRQGKTVDGKHYVPLDKGERFAVRLVNNYPDADASYLRLFVDGMNTLAYSSASARGMVPVSADSFGEKSNDDASEFAPLVDDVENATAWYLPKGKTAQITGFTLKTRGVEETKIAPFLVEAYSPNSFAALRGVDGSRVGLITAIFSTPKRTLSLSDLEPKLVFKDDKPQGEIAAQIVPPSETYVYRWERRKAGETEWKPVPGRVDKIYPLGDDDVDCFLRVVVRGQDAKLGEVSAETAAAVELTRGVGDSYSVAPDFTQKIVVNLAEAERLEDQEHTTFQIYHVSPEVFNNL